MPGTSRDWIRRSAVTLPFLAALLMLIGQHLLVRPFSLAAYGVAIVLLLSGLVANIVILPGKPSAASAKKSE
jgi:hypothetical protein